MINIFRATDRTGSIVDEVNIELYGKKLSINVSTYENSKTTKHDYQSAEITLTEQQTLELLKKLKELNS